MRKRIFTIICAVIALVTVACLLIACTGETNLIYFNTKSEANTPVYRIYLDTDVNLTPEVVTRPKNNEYTLTSSNPSIVKVNDDGRSVTALREGIVTLTATSDSKSATASIIVEAKKPITKEDAEKSGGFLVIFETEYGSVPGQIVAPGDKAVEPEEIYRPNGYKLYGWYTDANHTAKYDFNTPVNAHLALYALWGYAEPTYIFEPNGDGTTVLTGFEHINVPYENIVLPSDDGDGNTVVAIGPSAFAANSTIVSVTIPAGYRTIESTAFDECSALETVVLGPDIEEIRSDAFYACTKLKTVTFDGGLKKIDKYAFYRCTSLTSITLPDSVTDIGEYAFAECTSLSEFTLSSALETIELRTFAGCKIKSIDLKNVREIYNEAFAGCTELAEITGYDNLESIGSYVFGSLLRNSDQATAWLKNPKNQIVTEEGGVTGGKAVYLGDILVYVVPAATKCPIIYVKSSCTSIAGQALTDAGKATLCFTGAVPPSYSHSARPFGEDARTSGEETVYAPTADIIVPGGMTETYTRAFLHCNNDSDGDSVLPITYSLELCQRIYESVPTAITGLTVYSRKPFMEYESGVFYNSALAKRTGDPYKGITFLAESRYVIFDYRGSAESIDIKSELEADSAANNTDMVIERIDTYAFAASTSRLKSVILPINIYRIGEYAFSALTLTEVIFKGPTDFDPTNTILENYAFNINACTDLKIFVPLDMLGTYSKSSNWSAYNSRITGVR